MISSLIENYAYFYCNLNRCRNYNLNSNVKKGEMNELLHNLPEELPRVQSRVEYRQTKDFHDWFYRFLKEKLKEKF